MARATGQVDEWGEYWLTAVDCTRMAPRACSMDPAEPNDTPAEATLLSLPTYYTVDATNPDYYRIDASSGRVHIRTRDPDALLVEAVRADGRQRLAWTGSQALSLPELLEGEPAVILAVSTTETCLTYGLGIVETP